MTPSPVPPRRGRRRALIGLAMVAWLFGITAVYHTVRQKSRSGLSGATELLQIGALPVT